MKATNQKARAALVGARKVVDALEALASGQHTLPRMRQIIISVAMADVEELTVVLKIMSKREEEYWQHRTGDEQPKCTDCGVEVAGGCGLQKTGEDLVPLCQKCTASRITKLTK